MIVHMINFFFLILIELTEKTYNRLESALKQIWDSSKILKEGKPDQQASGLDILRV